MSAMDGAGRQIDTGPKAAGSREVGPPAAQRDQQPWADPAAEQSVPPVPDATASVGAQPARAGEWRVAEAIAPPSLAEVDESAAKGSLLVVILTAVVVIGVLAAFGWVIFAAWHYVTTASEAAQQAHWEQLRGLIDVVSAIVLLMIGTVLGTTLQSRWTTAAREQSARQARAAAQQHAAALANADAARTNGAGAQNAVAELATALRLLGRTRPLLMELEQLASDRDRARTQFVTTLTVISATPDPQMAGFRIERTGDVRLAETVDESVDRTITMLAARAQITGEEITGWLSGRR